MRRLFPERKECSVALVEVRERGDFLRDRAGADCFNRGDDRMMERHVPERWFELRRSGPLADSPA